MSNSRELPNSGKVGGAARAAPIGATCALVLAALLTACAAAPRPLAPGGPGPGGTGRGTAELEETSASDAVAPSKPALALAPATEPSASSRVGAAAPAEALAMDDHSKLSAGAAPSPPPSVEAPGPRDEAAPSPPAGTSAATAATGQSGLKAGFSDDNEQFNYFVKFLDEFGGFRHEELAVQERIIVKVLDSAGSSVMNAQVEVYSGGKRLARGKTYADGSFHLYPLELGAPQASSYELRISAPAGSAVLQAERAGPRSLAAKLGEKRAAPAPLPVDLLFVMDTTGSMGEEIERLRATIEIINANISSLKPKPALRFGMVLYKDKGDEYDTKVVPFTPSLGAFQEALDEVYADGGGDGPEDLQAALADAVKSMKWNADGIRLGFVVTDAPAHLDYGQSYTYASAARDAKAAAIKIFGIGTGGLPVEGEYLLRQVAQYTQGKYIFLTYGERGEAAGGSEGSVSHHTGSNFSTDKLEAVVIRFVKEEIARQSDKGLEYDEAYYAAKRTVDESVEDTLGKLFSQALQNLSDYSGFRIGPTTRCAIMPVVPVEAPDGSTPAGLSAQAEYFGSQLSLSAAKSKLFALVERKDLQAILGELELQLSGLADEEGAAKVGKLLGAEVLVTGTVFRAADRYELFLKLVRVETAEVLAATKAKIDPGLGL